MGVSLGEAGDRAGFAARFNEQLRSAAPPPGYAGFVAGTRGVAGQTFGSTCLSARETARRRGADLLSRESRMQSRGEMASDCRVLDGGRGLKQDLQPLHKQGASSDRIVRDKMTPRRALGSAMARVERKPPHPFPSYDPGGPRYPALGARKNPAEMEPAGSPSICAKFDTIRTLEYQRDRFEAKRTHEHCAVAR